MKRVLGALGALLIVVFGGYALAQASPVPPASSGGTVGPVLSADSGFLGNLTVLGTCTGCGGGGGISNPLLGTLIADGGNLNVLTVQGASTLVGPVTSYASMQIDGGIQLGSGGGLLGCIGQIAGFSVDLGMSSAACSSGAVPLSGRFLQTDGTNLNLNIGQTGTTFIYGGSSIVANLGTYSGHTALQLPGNLEVGTSGSFLNNAGIGTCALSSATCNAVVPGAGGSSQCTVGLVSNTALTTGMCTYVPDAGSASIYCPAATTGSVTIHCFN
jgi:hypothetical protein